LSANEHRRQLNGNLKTRTVPPKCNIMYQASNIYSDDHAYVWAHKIQKNLAVTKEIYKTEWRFAINTEAGLQVYLQEYTSIFKFPL